MMLYRLPPQPPPRSPMSSPSTSYYRRHSLYPSKTFVVGQPHLPLSATSLTARQTFFTTNPGSATICPLPLLRPLGMEILLILNPNGWKKKAWPKVWSNRALTHVVMHLLQSLCTWKKILCTCDA